MNDDDPRVADRCSTRCDHDSRCTLPAGHTPAGRHDTEHGCICYDPRDMALNDALSGEADAVRRAESAELGCEIAYRREPTQAEGDAHEHQNASEAIRECHVPMGNHHGHRCPCGLWVWGGPTVCQRCVDAEAVKTALLRADTDAKVAVEWEKLFFYVWTIVCVAATAIGIGWAGAWMQSKKYEAEARACECAEPRR